MDTYAYESYIYIMRLLVHFKPTYTSKTICWNYIHTNDTKKLVLWVSRIWWKFVQCVLGGTCLFSVFDWNFIWLQLDGTSTQLPKFTSSASASSSSYIVLYLIYNRIFIIWLTRSFKDQEKLSIMTNLKCNIILFKWICQYRHATLY